MSQVDRLEEQARACVPSWCRSATAGCWCHRYLRSWREHVTAAGLAGWPRAGLRIELCRDARLCFGASDSFGRALAGFAVTAAGQDEAYFDALSSAVASGRIAARGISARGVACARARVVAIVLSRPPLRGHDRTTIP